MFKVTINWIGKHIHNGLMLVGLKFHDFLKGGGWVTIVTLGGCGVLFASYGMVRILIEAYKENGATSSFWAMIFIGLIVWGVAIFGVWAIIDIIKRHKDKFGL